MRRRFWIEMGGDPSKDKEMRSRVMAGHPIEPWAPGIEILQVVPVADMIARLNNCLNKYDIEEFIRELKEAQ